jgi:hypothetical protein
MKHIMVQKPWVCHICGQNNTLMRFPVFEIWHKNEIKMPFLRVSQTTLEKIVGTETNDQVQNSHPLSPFQC